ncbi:MAG: sulfatase-like hydrolase/transferase, partial [Prosthecobacter sp.]|nr:sulfatase-like hydrolase/transferase [Prosthecobacter sp.]
TGITVPNCHVPQVVLQATTGKKAPPDQKAIQPDSVTRLKTEYRTLAETLKDAGYATAHFGKWHLGPEPYSPLQQGFDLDLPHHPGPGPAGSFVAPWKFANFKEKSPGEHIEDRMAAEAVTWMEQTSRAERDSLPQAARRAGAGAPGNAKPFYLNYWMFSVHAPFDAKKANIEKHRARIDPKDAQRSPTYAAMIQSMDDAIGTLLDGLDKLKLADNTIIIFTSDNGGNMYNEIDGTTPTSNRPLRGGKATMFEGGVRVPCVVVWPGIAAPGSRSDALVQSEDFYPTLLDGLQSNHLAPRDEQSASSASKAPDSPKTSSAGETSSSSRGAMTATFDGHSILPALKGDALAGKAAFQYFPHNPGVPDWLPPSVSVHRDDWKLIRIFHGGEKGAHRHLLFNLRDDLGEKNNLAAQKPELVAELDALIETFLTDTKAVVPVPNPAFDPAKYRPELEGKQQPKGKAKAPNKGKDDGDPALQGWKARDCKASVKDGFLRITNIGSEGFLGFSAGKHSGPTTAKFRIKAKAGTSHFDWLPGGVGGKQQRTDFTLKGGDWEEITVELPAEGPLGIVRLYLPMQEQPVEIDWIELASKNGSKPTRTGF